MGRAGRRFLSVIEERSPERAGLSGSLGGIHIVILKMINPVCIVHCLHMSVHHVHAWCLERLEKAIRFPGSGGTDSCCAATWVLRTEPSNIYFFKLKP